MEKIFKKYCDATNQSNKYGKVVIIDGKKCFKTFDGTIIKHLAYDGKHYPEDGVIRKLSEATCDGSCEVGKPLPKCVNGGAYSKPKCAVVMLEVVELSSVQISMSLGQLMILKDMLKGNKDVQVKSWIKTLPQIAAHASKRERQAQNAGRQLFTR